MKATAISAVKNFMVAPSLEAFFIGSHLRKLLGVR